MARPINQQLAEAEARLARLKAKSRSLETGQKIIAGAWVLTEARKHSQVRKWLISHIENPKTRQIDRERMQPILEELKALEAGSADKTAPQTSGKGKP